MLTFLLDKLRDLANEYPGTTIVLLLIVCLVLAAIVGASSDPRQAAMNGYFLGRGR